MRPSSRRVPVGITVTSAGSGYTAPVVAITGGVRVCSGATATAFGRVDAVALTDAGSGYTFPTVSFDQPDDPNGVPATGHVYVRRGELRPVGGRAGGHPHRRRR